MYEEYSHCASSFSLVAADLLSFAACANVAGLRVKTIELYISDQQKKLTQSLQIA